MGRGREKGKKLSVSNHEDPGSGEEEKIPAQKRRGRPQKPVKDDFDEEEVEKIEEVEKNGDDGQIVSNGVASKEKRSPNLAESGKKRKRSSHVKEKQDPLKEENDVINRSSPENLTKTNGFRHNGSRRKSKPRRAAEVGVECK